jgi:hypothetical protein
LFAVAVDLASGDDHVIFPNPPQLLQFRRRTERCFFVSALDAKRDFFVRVSAEVAVSFSAETLERKEFVRCDNSVTPQGPKYPSSSVLSFCAFLRLNVISSCRR